jgi:hypothetical protein
MKLAIEALLILAGFAAGVIFSTIVHAYVAKKIDKASEIIGKAHATLERIETSAAAEIKDLRNRLVELESKVKGIV